MAEMRVLSFNYNMTEDAVKMWINKDFGNLDARVRADVLGDVLSYMDKLRDLYDQTVEEYEDLRISLLSSVGQSI